jgi:hypothetical protein
MSEKPSPPAVLRKKAELCFKAAAAMPPGAEAEAMQQKGRDYLNFANQLEYGVEKR